MCPEFGHRLSGIHKEFKTGHRLKKELNFKTGTYRCLNFQNNLFLVKYGLKCDTINHLHV